MIFLNLAFIKGELMQQTIDYLNDETKEKLLALDSDVGFNGSGFNSFEGLKNFLNDDVHTYDNNYFERGSSRRVNEGTVENIQKAFKEDTPLYIDSNKLYRLMLLSSNLVFSPNEKVCLTVMFEKPYDKWSAEDIIQVAKEGYHLQLSKSKVEEALDRQIDSKQTDAYVVSSVQNGVKLYQIQFTNLIIYIKDFDKTKSLV